MSFTCPKCNNPTTKTVDSREKRTHEGTAIRRRRKCPKCNHVFSTLETLYTGPKSHALTPEAVRTIRRLHKAYNTSQSDLATKFRVTPSTINKILSRTRWT